MRVMRTVRQRASRDLSDSWLPSPECEGTPLPVSVRRQLEHSAGVCLAAVRVIEGDLRRWTAAPAFAYGHRVFVQRGFFQPDTRWGQHLLAHEVAHVLQQSAGRVRPSPGRGFINDDPCLEAEADAFADRVLNGVAAAAAGTLDIAPCQLSQPVLQCAVGFEFQTGWRVYRELPAAGGQPRLQELPKETAIYGGRQSGLGWTMETDGPELEFVIQPPVENRREVAEVFGRLQLFLLKLEVAGRARSPLRPSTHSDLFNIQHRHTNLVIIPDPTQLDAERISAQPQITPGVRLSRLHILFAELGRLGLEVNDPTFDRNAPESLYFSEKYREISQRAAAAAPVNGQQPSQRLRGFMSMISQYLHAGSLGGTRAYAKDMAYAMARTDFAAMFSSLPQAERSYFQQNPEAWVQYALQTARLPPNSANERLINQRISDGGVLRPFSASPPIHLPLTRGAWLRAMASPTQPRDLFTASATAGVPEYTDGNGKSRLHALGLLGNRQDAVGHGKDGVIVELRQMQRKVPWPDWIKLAYTMVDYITELNGRKVEAEQWPPEFDSTFR
jgi:hypothetical protein